MRDDQYARREAFTPSVKLFGCLLSVSMMVALSATRRPANVAAVVRVTVPQVAGCALFHALNRGRPAVVAGGVAVETRGTTEAHLPLRFHRVADSVIAGAALRMEVETPAFPLGMHESSTHGRQVDREVWLCGSHERQRPEAGVQDGKVGRASSFATLRSPNTGCTVWSYAQATIQRLGTAGDMA
jgi:hypothetical protein